MAEVRDAEVTIVGGGAVGCAVAYVLAGAATDIQVIEQGELAGATSGQAAGLVGQVRATRERCRLAMASVASTPGSSRRPATPRTGARRERADSA